MKLVSVTANFESFHPVRFNEGLSVVVAERAETAGLTDSRNGLGKTTLLAIIDFCLGANASPQIEQMRGRAWAFSLCLSTRSGADLTATRGVDSASDIVLEGDLQRLGLADRDEANSEPLTRLVIGPGKWKAWLGEESFPQPFESDGMPPPTYRSLIRHFIRYRLDAFLKPFASMANPGALQIQSENAFLLNLDWRLAHEWQALTDRGRRLQALDDPENDVDERIAELQAKLIREQRHVERLTEEVQGFSVVPEYRQVERDVDEWAASIKRLANDNISDRRLIRMYEQRRDNESSTASVDIVELFAEAGVALGEQIVRSLDEAAAFHAAVISNRAAYLSDELRKLQDRVRSREEEQASLAAEQTRALQLLRAGGALEDFAVIQQNLGTAQAQVVETQSRIDILSDLRRSKAQLRSDLLDLKSRITSDLDERLDRRAPIIARFGEILEGMYDEEADLKVSLGRGGFAFSTTLPRSGSSGVDKMAIFAYDIAVSESMSDDGRGPGFLIHDSTMFDGVDERQVAEAIGEAIRSTERHGYQYIVTLNSDVIPYEELDELELREPFDAAIVLKLSDVDESGSLLGVRLRPELNVNDSTDNSVGVDVTSDVDEAPLD